MYADYNFYVTEYLGSLIPETAYTKLAIEASAYIDYLTHNRIVTTDLPEKVQSKVKMAVCSVAETWYKQLNDEAPAVSSETVGNHSKSFTVTKKSFAEWEREKLSKVKMYLYGTGLMYGGLR